MLRWTIVNPIHCMCIVYCIYIYTPSIVFRLNLLIAHAKKKKQFYLLVSRAANQLISKKLFLWSIIHENRLKVFLKWCSCANDANSKQSHLRNCRFGMHSFYYIHGSFFQFLRHQFFTGQDTHPPHHCIVSIYVFKSCIQRRCIDCTDEMMRFTGF